MKKNSVLVMLLIVLMCVSLVFTGCQKAGDNGDNGDDETTSTTGDKKDPEKEDVTFETPGEQVTYAFDQTMSAMIKTDAIGSVLGEAIKGGKITVEVADMIENVLYLDVMGNQYADILTIEQDGEAIEVGAYLKNGKLAVSAPMLFGDEAYGIDFNTLDADLKNSELWALMGTTYEEFVSQSGIDFDALMGAVEDYMDAIADAGSSLEDSLKNVEVTSEEGTVTINGETVDAVNVKYHMTSDDVQDVMDAYLDEMENMMDAMKDSFADVLTGVDMDEIMADMDFDTIRDEMVDVFANVDLAGDLVISIDPETQYIMSISHDITGTFDGEEGKIDMDLVLGVDPTNSDKYSFTMFVEADGDRMGATVDLTFASEGSVDTTTLTVNEVYNDETTPMMTGKLTYDNASGAYDVSMTANEETIGVTGIYKVSADKFEFSVETIVSNSDYEEYTQEIGLRLSVEAIDKAEMPEMPNMKNILKMTQDEWTELLSLFEGFAEPAPEYPEDIYGDDYFDEDIYGDDYSDEGFYFDYNAA
jgi:hypothetical protein